MLVEHDMVSEQRAVDCILILQKRIEELEQMVQSIMDKR